MTVTRILLCLSCVCLLAATAGAASLQFGDPNDLSIADSIPGGVGEKVVLFNKGLPADWVIALVNLSYDEARDGIREIIHNSMGIQSENEIIGRIEPGKSLDNRPKEPLFGNGAIDFISIGAPVTEGREVRIQTKHYNESWWNNYSTSTWRIIDGSRLFGKACSLIVVTRIDRSRQWFVLHPGIPLPFKISDEVAIVTDSEIKLIDRFQKATGQRKLQYFVMPNRSFSSTILTEVMTTIRDAAKMLP